MVRNLNEAIEAYLLWRGQEGFAKNTVRNDRSGLHYLQAVVPTGIHVSEITRDHVRAALEEAEKTRTAASINAIHATMSAFFKWCRIMRHAPLDHDPLLGIRYRRVGKKDFPRLSPQEFGPFLDAAHSPRDRILGALGLYLFLRGSEAVSLRVRDVKLDAGTIGVTVWKTKDYDIMPISRELDRELRAWFIEYQKACGPLQPDWYLAPSYQASRFNPKLVPTNRVSRPEDVIKRNLTTLGWDDTYWQGFHLLRRSGARAWFDELSNLAIDHGLRIVSAHLHHSSIAMTERYLGLTADRAKRDRLLKGEEMFPSVSSTKVVQLRRLG